MSRCTCKRRGYALSVGLCLQELFHSPSCQSSSGSGCSKPLPNDPNSFLPQFHRLGVFDPGVRLCLLYTLADTVHNQYVCGSSSTGQLPLGGTILGSHASYQSWNSMLFVRTQLVQAEQVLGCGRCQQYAEGCRAQRPE